MPDEFRVFGQIQIFITAEQDSFPTIDDDSSPWLSRAGAGS
jgi:hypothetical protein